MCNVTFTHATLPAAFVVFTASFVLLHCMTLLRHFYHMATTLPPTYKPPGTIPGTACYFLPGGVDPHATCALMVTYMPTCTSALCLPASVPSTPAYSIHNCPLQASFPGMPWSQMENKKRGTGLGQGGLRGSLGWGPGRTGRNGEGEGGRWSGWRWMDGVFETFSSLHTCLPSL